jgi:aminotransferase
MSYEIYARLVYGIEHTCFARFPECRTHCAAGWIFQGLCHDRLASWLRGRAKGNLAAKTKIHQYTIIAAYHGAGSRLEALRGGEDSVHEMVDDYNAAARCSSKGCATSAFHASNPKALSKPS